MSEIELNPVRLGKTQKENYDIINTNFSNLDIGKLDTDGTAANAEKVNNHTVESDVPANVGWFTPEEKEDVVMQEDLEDGVKYSNDTPIVKELGGIKVGETFDNISVQDMLDKLLYPYVAPEISMVITPDGGVYEKGTTIAVTRLDIKAVKKSKDIKQVEAKKGEETSLKVVTENVAGGGTFSCLPNPCQLTETCYIKGIVTDTDNSTVSVKSNAFNFVDPFYYGAVAIGAEINSSTITGLTKVVEAKGNKTFKHTTNNGCMVIAYPRSYGDLKSAKDANGFENLPSYTKKEIIVTCASGEVGYFVYIKEASTVTNFAITYSF